MIYTFFFSFFLPNTFNYSDYLRCKGCKIYLCFFYAHNSRNICCKCNLMVANRFPVSILTCKYFTISDDATDAELKIHFRASDSSDLWYPTGMMGKKACVLGKELQLANLTLHSFVTGQSPIGKLKPCAPIVYEWSSGSMFILQNTNLRGVLTTVSLTCWVAKLLPEMHLGHHYFLQWIVCCCKRKSICMFVYF